MKRLPFFITALLFGVNGLSTAQQQAQGKIIPEPVSSTGSSLPRYQILNINNITTWMRSDGQTNHAPTGDNGCYYPRGTAWVLYQDGLLWVGKAYLDSSHTIPAPTQLIRAGGQMYNISTRQGWVEGMGASATPLDPADERARMYRIRRDYAEMTHEELMRDASEFFEVRLSDVTLSHVEHIRSQYHADWNQWPVERGAPYIERNGIPGYQPPPPFGPSFRAQHLIPGNHDEPGISGGNPDSPADQVLWRAYNDLNVYASQSFAGSLPLGLEFQTTLWGYKSTGPFGQIYFKRERFINKGGVDIGGGQNAALWIDSMFIAQWSDPDIGSFGDDLVGCDTLRQMGFAYNSRAVDQYFQQFTLPAPAVGYSLVQGPVIPGLSGDSAVFDFRWIYGRRNVPMTSFTYSIPGTGSELPFSYELSLRLWRQLQGYVPDPSTSPFRLYPHPPGVEATRFPLSGNPVNRTGFIDGLGTTYSFPPGDRRMTMNAGPFTLAPGDTQEILVATIGGLGADHLSAITAMKFNDRAVKQALRTFFTVPNAPPAPLVNVTELDGAIILEWGSDHARVSWIEDASYADGYAFEGYNVYQIPSPSAALRDGKRIATFDVINGVLRIVDEGFDPATGLVSPVVLHYGSDSGIQRHIEIRNDALRGSSVPLRNGERYHFAVTAYTYSANLQSFPRAVESEPRIVTGRPRIPFGLSASTHFGDTLEVTHVSGRSDGSVHPIVADPLLGTGDVYEVKFDTSGGEITWFLRNMSKDRVVLGGQANQSGNTDYPIVEGGIYLKVLSPPPGLKREHMFSTGDTSQWGWRWFGATRFLTWAGGDGLALGSFFGAFGAHSPYVYFINPASVEPVSRFALKPVEIRFAGTLDNSGNPVPSDTNVSFAYRYGRAFQNPPARPEFAPYILNPSGGYAYQDYTRSVPLAVYDVDSHPPRRLAVGFLESNVAAGSVNGRYWPPFFGDNDNVSSAGPREWLFIFDEEYTAATAVPELQQDLLNTPLPVMYWATWTRRYNDPWPSGNTLAFYVNRPNLPEDVFRYVVPPPDTSDAAKRTSSRLVGVFPNPYYAGQSDGAIAEGRFVTFSNLPVKATIRIFNLAGHLVRRLEKEDGSQFLAWDLTSEEGWVVASGMYICHVEMPEIGEVRVLKLAVIQGEIIPPVR